MSGLIRKVVVVAAIDGLILQAHGPVEHHKLLHINYETHQVTSHISSQSKVGNDCQRLESHGIIGLLSIFSLSYLIAITRREQVAQIFGKPVYVITDVALVPLASQDEAAKAIEAASTTHRMAGIDESDSDSDASLHADLENTADGQIPVDPADAVPPSDSEENSQRNPTPRSSIAEDVFAKRGLYGRFASQWFSRKGWGMEKKAEEGLITGPPAAHADKLGLEKDRSMKLLETAGEPSETIAQQGPEVVKTGLQTHQSEMTTISELLPKILRSTKLILTSRSFFFSYEHDLTRSIGSGSSIALQDSRPDPVYFWNAKLGAPLINNGYQRFLMPIMQGFAGQRSFTVKWNNRERSHSVVAQPLELQGETEGHTDSSIRSPTEAAGESTQSFLLTVVSRRSTRRSGLRYLRRGIDDEGNCANFVETEQILSCDPWEQKGKLRSFLQIRGSIPLYFSQTPYSFKPVPVLHHSSAENQKAFKAHFEKLEKRYGDVQIALLVDKHGGELAVGEAYETATKKANDSGDIHAVDLNWFDFHAECRGMKFENVELLVKSLGNAIKTHGQTVMEGGKIIEMQSGVIRTNCMDCLDRTNVVQSAFAQHILQGDLQEMGFDIDLVNDDSTQWFNSLWADNGDAISKAYAGSSALKGDFTRTRKRNYRGALNDFGLTLTRYYNNIVNDYFSQAVIDVLLGNISAKVFEDFESNMMSTDPGISIEKVRQAAIETCAKIVIQDTDEDLIQGWTLLSPAQTNTLRTLPFEEIVVLLTDGALYCCKFDWSTEKVASFEKVDLRSITRIKYGTYITSTLTERQRDEKLHAGLAITYTPGKGSVIRVNTRSLQSTVPEGHHGIDGGTGVLSWLGSSSPPTENSRTMALKIIARTIEEKSSQTPMASAEGISNEIKRAALAGGTVEGKEGESIVSEGDIISLAEAKQKTSYIEQVTHSIKKLVWT